MNLLKSIFIFLAPAWLMFVCYIAIKGLIIKPNIISLGVLLSALPLLLFLSSIMLLRNLARTSQHLIWVSLPSIIGYISVLMTIILLKKTETVTDLMFAMSAFLVTLLYIYWYSYNGRTISHRLNVGQELPEFSLITTEGESISSKQLSHQSAIIFFYRGNWCPLCMAQIDEIAAQYQKFAQKNIDVIFISPQPSKNTQQLAKKYNLDFKFFIDKENKAAKYLGIEHTFGLPMGFQALGYDSNSVYPTIIAIDKMGKIIYCDQTSNYRVRPEPQELLALFK